MATMIEAMAAEELDHLLEPIPGAEKRMFADNVGWPVEIDFQTFCQRLISYGFSNVKLAQAKAALIEAELAYRYCGKKKEVKT